MVQIQGNKIIIPVEVMLQNKEEIRATINEVQKLKDDLQQLEQKLGTSATGRKPSERQAMKQSISSEVQSSAQDAYGEEGDIPPNMLEMEGEEDPEDLTIGMQGIPNIFRRTAGMISSPTGSLLAGVTSIIPEIGAALIAWGIAQKIIEQVYGPGGWLDVRFKRDMRSEIESYFTRQQQMNRKVGVTGVIITASGGFRSLNGANVENTLKEVKTFGVARIGLQDKAMGRRP